MTSQELNQYLQNTTYQRSAEVKGDIVSYILKEPMPAGADKAFEEIGYQEMLSKPTSVTKRWVKVIDEGRGMMFYIIDIKHP